MDGLPGEIKCLFFSQFHPIAGPKISCQVPESFPLRDIFDEVHDLIITKPQLYDRLISIEVGEYRVIGCPKCIADNKYERNAFIFNFVFVFSSSINTSAYEPIIQKLGNAFRTYELESSFLSGDNYSSQVLPSIMENIRNNLNSCGFCNIRVDDTNRLNLKIIPYLQHPPEIEDYHVPIFTCTKEDIHNTKWDLTIEQILPFINGFSHVKKIASESEVAIEIVRICIQHLVLYGFLQMIAIFQYSNVYVTQPKLRELLTDMELQRECLEYVGLQGGSTPSISNVFRLYSSLEAGLTVADLCVHNDLPAMGINERMLIQYGLMRGLIRQLRKYPVYVKSEESDVREENLQPLLPYLDGSHSFDEICCQLCISSQELDNLVDSSMNCLVCWK